jgi:phosphocarrier protein
MGVVYIMEQTVKVTNKSGIHARPASVFVQTAAKFKSKVTVTAKGKTVDAKSILMIMSMGLVKDTEIVIKAEGEDASAAVKALVDLVQAKFGEE